MMVRDIMYMLLFVFVLNLSFCHDIVDVEYSEKVVSDRKGDGFGSSLATSLHKLVVGAKHDDNWRGSVTVWSWFSQSVRVKGPSGGMYFGEHVDVNQQLM